MAGSYALDRALAETWTDEDIVRRVVDGDVLLYELLMRRNNQRIYRAIRSILRDDLEIEEVMQEAYVRAFEHLSGFEGRSRFSTWITRIAVNEALKHAMRSSRLDPLDENGHEEQADSLARTLQAAPTPELEASRAEMGALLEKAILALPESYRSVVVLRDIEEMSTADTAEALSLTEANVKVRLHRAHELLREELLNLAGAGRRSAFAFLARRCDRVVKAVFERIGAVNSSPGK
jgi:RNA polymerase sigma-70 factor (ECF subfamily)